MTLAASVRPLPPVGIPRDLECIDFEIALCTQSLRSACCASLPVACMQGAKCYVDYAIRLLQLTRGPMMTPMTNSNIVILAGSALP